MNKPDHILLVEAKSEGHHLFYVAVLADAMRRLGQRVTIGLPDVKVFARKVQTTIPWFQSDQYAYHPISAGGRNTLLKEAAAAMQTCGATEVFFACLDEVASWMFRRAAFGLMPPKPLRGALSGVYIRPRVIDERGRDEISVNLWLKSRGWRLLDRRGWFKRILVLDERIPETPSCALIKTPISFMPEPSAISPELGTDSARARSSLCIPADRIVFLQYGIGTKRKGLQVVIDSWRQLPATSKAFLLCAGEIDPSFIPALRQLEAEGKARVLDRYVSSEEEHLCFEAADVVLAAYVNHYGSSNVLTRAAAFGRPVLASDHDLVGHRVRKYGLGCLCLHNDSQSLMENVLAMSRENPINLHQVYSKPLAAFAKLGSREMVAACLAGRPAQPEAAESTPS